MRYSARFMGSGEELEVFVVLEHQSRTDRLMSFRMLDYVFPACRRQALSLKKGMRFPYPLAVVQYHGKTPWMKLSWDRLTSPAFHSPSRSSKVPRRR